MTESLKIESIQSLPPETIGRQLEGLPARPGVYMMKDGEGKILYVGKAINLRTRVRSYFREAGDGRLSVGFFRAKVAAIETVVTATEKEALLLENVLIKKHKPRYNVRLRDDKTYISLRLDVAHEWPRVHRVRRRSAGDKALYFGPYSSSAAVKETMRFLQRLFPLRSCPDSVLRNRSRPCILHQIDRCCAPCVGLVDHERYNEFVDQTILFLNGRQDEVLELLENKMMEYSDAMAFEKAAVVRDRIRAIQRTVEVENVVSHRRFDRDVIAMARGGGRAFVAVFPYRAGNLESPDTFALKDPGHDDATLMEAFLGQYYDGTRSVPRDVLLSCESANSELMTAALTAMREGPVRLTMPRRGDKVRLVELAAKNARHELEKLLAGEQSRERVLADLESSLHLPRTPRRIECFDISNIQGTFVVGSMTCFIDGDPEKSLYRHFKVRSVDGQDDFASMREVLTRRYARVLREGGDLPDLVVIDGGKGQLNIAVEVFRELDLLGRVPVCGLAKARLESGAKGRAGTSSNHSEERVFLPNRKSPIVFGQSDPALFVLTRIRDEAHRFGIAYHRKLRASASLRTGLEEIPGVGPKRRRELLRHFGSLTRIRAATAEELATAPGVNAKLATEIHAFLHRPDASAETEPEHEDETQ